MMNKDNITYFENEGNSNFDCVISVVEEYLKTLNNAQKIVVFAGKMDSVLKLHNTLNTYDVSITVATYPFGREFTKYNKENEEPEIIIPDVTTLESKAKILELGMNYIQGGLPFEPIRSCTGDNSTEMIVSTLDLISRGLVHCISAAVMAKENGYVEENEKIIALSGDTAIIVTPTIRRDLFSGDFKIHKILCKPL